MKKIIALVVSVIFLLAVSAYAQGVQDTTNSISNSNVI